MYEQMGLFVTNLLFVFVLGWYLITNLQWYNYSLERVVLKHHKPLWHLMYFIIPFIAYYTTGKFFAIFFYFAILPGIFIWHKRLDKKVVLTWRVRRFLILLVGLSVFQNFLCTLQEGCAVYGVFLPLAVTYVGSFVIEKYLFMVYQKQASTKLESMKNLKIIAITGSYGKTSMKNFMTQILSQKFKVYATPRSVNTIGGIIRDVNESLNEDVEIYICEAGARERGDIYTIAQFLHPHLVVVGKVGPQHIEYFKTMENIIRTKLELMQSDRLEHAFVHNSVTDTPHEKVTFFGDGENVIANLEGTSFQLRLHEKQEQFETKVLGGFQTINMNASILIADALGMSMQEIQKGVKALNSVEHRLERIDAGGKIILDDGYNGNIDGMLEGIRLCSLHEGRKVIVTPGLVESSPELNQQLIHAINDLFDIAIITGSLNAEIFDTHLNVPKKIMLADKATLTTVLGQSTQSGDIILFANDAPNFI
ncbi:MAG: UDP-N-acetylmuramoyl-tripeptide--D-alanyl-D-alanine ligase [Campylobacterota bacterium]|nr:UDP-N-acetylmuramoyl-tripeptide--D-alanyl-D-alanine ligase [Campylobacterota bacterium]